MRPEKELDVREKWLCIDFVNTNDWHTSPHPVESLFRYADLTAWCQKKRLISPDEASNLDDQATRFPEEAEATLIRAIDLREAIYRILTACVEEKSAATADISLLNAEISLGAVNWKLKPAADGVAWEWDATADNLAALIAPIARSAADLLTSPELFRVGICADQDGCGFLFFDTSRNRSRRWCSMEDCGNRAKAQRHYRRQKDAGGKKLAGHNQLPA